MNERTKEGAKVNIMNACIYYFSVLCALLPSSHNRQRKIVNSSCYYKYAQISFSCHSVEF